MFPGGAVSRVGGAEHHGEDGGRTPGASPGRVDYAVSLFSPDTDPAAARVLAAGLRRRDVRRKLAMMGQLHAAARELAAAGVRRRHPGLTPAAVSASVRSSFLEQAVPPREFAAYRDAGGRG